MAIFGTNQIIRTDRGKKQNKTKQTNKQTKTQQPSEFLKHVMDKKILLNE